MYVCIVYIDISLASVDIFVIIQVDLILVCSSCRYRRSESCPFCRGSLKRIRSRDLWVLTNYNDVVDPVTLERENVRHFYSYIDSLPLILPDNIFFFYYDYLL